MVLVPAPSESADFETSSWRVSEDEMNACSSKLGIGDSVFGVIRERRRGTSGVRSLPEGDPVSRATIYMGGQRTWRAGRSSRPADI